MYFEFVFDKITSIKSFIFLHAFSQNLSKMSYESIILV